MNKIWFIYKDDQTFGPFDAVEIRGQLRDGSLDPFDLVGKHGSTLRRELVEVDEIFLSENNLEFQKVQQAHNVVLSDALQIQSQSEGSSTVVRRPQEPDGQLSEFESTGHSLVELNVIAEGALPAIKVATSKEAPREHSKTVRSVEEKQPEFAKHTSPKTSHRRDPKRFQIIDPRGKVLGPLSAGEIQSLFYKGVLPSSVVVAKVGSNSKVPIEKFVKVYSSVQKKNVQQGAHPHLGLLSSAKMNQMAMAQNAANRILRGANQNTVRWLGVVMALILFSGGCYFGYQIMSSNGSKWFAKNSRVKVKSKKKKSIRSSGKLPRPAKWKTKSKSKWTKKRKKSYKNKNTKRRHGPKKARIVKQASRKRYTPKKVAYKPKKKQSPAKLTVASLRAGMNVSNLGPMAFSAASIGTCQMKCSILMSGAGGSVTVKFFKIHYGSKLSSKSGRVYISGLVQKTGGQTTILLNGVR